MWGWREGLGCRAGKETDIWDTEERARRGRHLAGRGPLQTDGPGGRGQSPRERERDGVRGAPASVSSLEP